MQSCNIVILLLSQHCILCELLAFTVKTRNHCILLFAAFGLLVLVDIVDPGSKYNMVLNESPNDIEYIEFF